MGTWTTQKMERYLAEGRGSGERESYKPWIRTGDYKSQGRSTRIRSWTAHRTHHLLSDNETRYFYLLDWEPSVTDLREHYPLLDLLDVLGEPDDISLQKYQDKDTGTPLVLTLTFLITTQSPNGDERMVARSIKSSYELEKPSVVERFELMRRYFAAKGIEWGLVTEKEIPLAKAKNIEWVHAAKEIDNEAGLANGHFEELLQLLVDQLGSNSASVRRITTDFDTQMHLEKGTGLLFFKHLVATRRLKVNMEEPIDVGRPGSDMIRGVVPVGGDGSCAQY